MDDISDEELQRRADQRRWSLSEARLAYTVAEFSNVSGIGRSKLYLERKAGKLRFRKCGKLSLITHDDGLAYLNALPAA
jgi:hypothetical protein